MSLTPLIVPSRIFYHIVSGNEDSHIAIERTTGTLMANISFDRETTSQYSLLIRATNDPDYYLKKKERRLRDVIDADRSVAHVKITILDINDNPPRFEKNEYFAGTVQKRMRNLLRFYH